MPKTCLEMGIPSRLHRNGNDEIVEFPETERFYRRFNLSSVEFCKELKEDPKNYKHNSQVFESHTMSVLCSSLCESHTDVLYNTEDDGLIFDGWGVAEFDISTINSFRKEIINGADRRIYTAQMKHKSEECMYPHCEVIVYRDGVALEDVEEPPKSVRSGLRVACMGGCTILKYPEICEEESDNMIILLSA